MKEFKLYLAGEASICKFKEFYVSTDFYGDVAVISPEHVEPDAFYWCKYDVMVSDQAPNKSYAEVCRENYRIHDEIKKDLVRRGLAFWTESDTPGCAPGCHLDQGEF